MAFLKRTTSKKKDASEAHEMPVVERGQIQKNEMIGILRYPHVTEKAAVAARNNTYVFAVAEGANKAQVKKAVETRYGVTVTGVRMVSSHVKEVRRGRQLGYKRGIKKAYTTISKGQTIEIQ